MIVYRNDGWTKLICDVCQSQETDFYVDLPTLFKAIYFNYPSTSDHAGWSYGPGKMVIGAAYQPAVTLDPTKQVCGTCRGLFPELFWASEKDFHRYDGVIGKIGRPERTSAAEDANMNKPVEQLMKEGKPTQITPRVFPTSEPDISHDKNYRLFDDEELYGGP